MAAKATTPAGMPLAIAGHVVLVTHESVPISSIRLNPDNPRIRILVEREFGKKVPTPAELEGLIKSQPAFDGLQKAIRKAGGIFEPVIVSHDGLVVEGNTRMTVFSVLHNGNKADARWINIPVTRLPKSVPPAVLEVLMASYHVAGKTGWRGYAQADSIFRQHRVHRLDIKDIAESMRMGPKDVEQYIEAYEYLINEVLPHAPGDKGQQVLESKWSYALEFVKKKALTEFRKDPEVRKDVAKAIAEGRIKKGEQVRDLHKILGNSKASAALKTTDFNTAMNVLRKSDPVSASKLLKQMERLTEHIGNMDQREMDLFKKSKDAREVLIALHKKIRDAAAILSVKLGG
jgi:hypothetical protein